MAAGRGIASAPDRGGAAPSPLRLQRDAAEAKRGGNPPGA